MKIFISPSDQTGNPYSYGGTNEAAQMRVLAAATATALQAKGHQTLIGADSTPQDDYAKRPGEANAWGAELYICLHSNANGPGGALKGVTTFAYPDSVANKYVTAIHGAIAAMNPWGNRGIVAKTDLYEINAAQALVVYVEVSYHDNAQEAKWIIDNTNAIAQAIANGVQAAGAPTSGGGATGGGTTGGGGTVPQPAGVDVFYRVRTQDYGWLPEVKNLDDYAGWNDSLVTDVAMRVSAGSVKYQAHLYGAAWGPGYWLPWVTGCDINEPNNGYAGLGGPRPIDAVRAVLPGSAKTLQYRVAPPGMDYFPWQRGDETTNGQDGYAGAFDMFVARFQAVVVN